MNLPLETPNARRLLRFVSDSMLSLGGAPGLLKLAIDDPGEDGRREHVKDYLIGPDTPSDRTTLEVLHEAQEQADGSGPGSHRFRVQVFAEGAPKAFRSTSVMVEAELGVEDVRRVGSASTLLEQAYRRIDADQKFIQNTFGATFHALTTTIGLQNAALEQVQSTRLQDLRMTHEVVKARAEFEVDVETKKAMMAMLTPIVQVLGPKLVKKLLKDVEDDDVEDAEVAEVAPASTLPQTVTAPVLPAIAASNPKNGHAVPSKRKGNKNVSD